MTKLKEHPTCINPLTVAVVGKNLRFVIDLRQVNVCLVKPKFRYEDLRSLSEEFQRYFWFVSWDLKLGYPHVDIYEPHQTYLRFFCSLILVLNVNLCLQSLLLGLTQPVIVYVLYCIAGTF